MTTHRTEPFASSDEPPPAFGTVFTDHMLQVEWTAARGWGPPRILPYGPLALAPTAAALHYGQTMFEGIKAFRGVDDHIRVFRLERHCQRMHASAPRLCLPALAPDALARAILSLVEKDAAWVPRAPNASLYIRPALIATEAHLGLRPAERCLFFVVLCPVGSYFGGAAARPLRIVVEREMTRASRGGLGAVKAGANYAASMLATTRARSAGYDQVLWLDGQRHDTLEEVGTMNLFVQLGDELVTPALSDSILEGVTRDCVLALAREWGLRVSERPLTLAEVSDAHAAGQLGEIFGSGTAAAISPIGELVIGDRALVINDGRPGPLAGRLLDEITRIQRGACPDRHGWTTRVERLGGASGHAGPPAMARRATGGMA